MKKRSPVAGSDVRWKIFMTLALWLSVACASTGLSEEKACEMSRTHLSEAKYAAGWQYCDFDRFPSSCYKDVEVLECFEFLTKVGEGWASIQVEAMGDEFHAEDGKPLGRTRFQSAVEFRRTIEGWEVTKKASF